MLFTDRRENDGSSINPISATHPFIRPSFIEGRLSFLLPSLQHRYWLLKWLHIMVELHAPPMIANHCRLVLSEMCCFLLLTMSVHIVGNERLVWPQGDAQCQQVNDEQDACGDREASHGISRRGACKRRFWRLIIKFHIRGPVRVFTGPVPKVSWQVIGVYFWDSFGASFIV